MNAMANEVLPEGISEGKVLKVLDVMGYNYLKVDQNKTIRWVAIAKAPVQVGDMVGYDTKTTMKNFKSKQLDRVFDEIIFANSVYLPQKNNNLGSLKSSLAISEKQLQMDKTNLEPFVEKEFYTVEEVHRYRKELNGKIIKVKAKVYKVSHSIMNLDWVHLGDGTGNEEALTDDFVITTKQSHLSTGQEVVATSTIVIDKNFGYGYFYEVLGENGSFD
jgi:predicted heme/steroid binding protein